MRWKVFSKLIMVEQTLFALPWVLTAAILPFYSDSFASEFKWDQWSRWLCILTGFISARTAGMAFNRVIDRKIDEANPRTQDRTLPAGDASIEQVTFIAWANVLIFILSCACLNTICLALSPLVVALLWLYSYTKRHTALCHLVLGVVQFFGPFFAWVAITDNVAMPPIWLGFGVLASIAGMDIIYALQDLDFDKKFGLHSVPVAFGAKNSLWIARMLHLLAVWLLFQVGITMQANAVFMAGVVVIGAIYIYFHMQIDEKNLRHINRNFFSCNAFVGMTLLLFTLGSLAWHVLS